MNTEYGKSRYIKYSHGAAEARQHGTHTMWPNSKRRFFSLFNSENIYLNECQGHEAVLIKRRIL